MDHLDVDNMSTRNFCLHAREAGRRRGGGEEAAARRRGGGGEEAATQWIGRLRPPWCMLRNTPVQLEQHARGLLATVSMGFPGHIPCSG